MGPRVMRRDFVPGKWSRFFATSQPRQYYFYDAAKRLKTVCLVVGTWLVNTPSLDWLNSPRGHGQEMAIGAQATYRRPASQDNLPPKDQ